MEETEEGKKQEKNAPVSEPIKNLEKLSNWITEYGELLENLKENVDNAIAEVKGLDLSPVAKAEIKEIKEVAFYLAKLQMLMTIAFMQNFRTLTERILEKVKEGTEELIKLK